MVAPGFSRPFGASPSGGSSARCIDPSRLVWPTVATALAGTIDVRLQRHIHVDVPAVQPSSCRRCRRRRRRSSPANSTPAYRRWRARRDTRPRRHRARPRPAAAASSRLGMHSPVTVTMTLHPIASSRRPLDVPITAVSRRLSAADLPVARRAVAAPLRAGACPATWAAVAQDREPSGSAGGRAVDRTRRRRYVAVEARVRRHRGRVGGRRGRLALVLRPEPVLGVPEHVVRRGGGQERVEGSGRCVEVRSCRSAGPRYCAQSLPVSGDVTFSRAPIIVQMAHVGFDRLFSTNTPLAAPVRGSNML